MEMGTEEKLNKSISLFIILAKISVFYLILSFCNIFFSIELNVVKSVISYECWFPLPFIMIDIILFVE